MQISINANRCEPSPMRKFHPLAVAAEQRGKKIYHLNIGQPDIATPSAYFEAVRKYDPQTLAYDASPGNPELIRAVQNYYAGLGVDLEPRDILITTGGSEALLLTCLSILDPYTALLPQLHHLCPCCRRCHPGLAHESLGGLPLCQAGADRKPDYQEYPSNSHHQSGQPHRRCPGQRGNAHDCGHRQGARPVPHLR